MAEQVLTDISVFRTSPLAHLESALVRGSVTGERGVTLREIAFTAQIGLRAEPGTAGHEALAAATGVGLPSAVGMVAGGPNGAAVLWSGPDDFLVIAPEGTELINELLDALGDTPGQVVNLSANRTVIEVSGPGARQALEKGCPADLHPRAFGVGTAITTALGPVPVLLWKTEEDCFRLLPRASFADYTARWLLDAISEFASDPVA